MALRQSVWRRKRSSPSAAMVAKMLLTLSRRAGGAWEHQCRVARRFSTAEAQDPESAVTPFSGGFVGMVTGVRTSLIPVTKRCDYRYDMTVETLIPNMLRSDHAPDSRAERCLPDLGFLDMSELSFPPLESWRTAKLIRQSDTEMHQEVRCDLLGWCTLTQGGRSKPGSGTDAILASTPCHWHIGANAGTKGVKTVSVPLPRQIPPLPQGRIRSLSAVRLGGRVSAGVAMLAGFLKQRTAVHSYTAADVPRPAAAKVEMRLRELTASRHHHRTVQAVTGRWGFNNKAYCSRVYRVAYDIPPGDLRHLVQDKHGGSSTAQLPQTTTGPLSSTGTGDADTTATHLFTRRGES